MNAAPTGRPRREPSPALNRELRSNTCSATMTHPQPELFRRPENWLLLAFFAALTFQSLWAALHGVMLSKRAALAVQFVLSVVVALWVMYDSGRHGIRRPFIFGFFLFVAWPLVAPFHLWRTRRWRGLVTVMIFGGL